MSDDTMPTISETAEQQNRAAAGEKPPSVRLGESPGELACPHCGNTTFQRHGSVSWTQAVDFTVEDGRIVLDDMGSDMNDTDVIWESSDEEGYECASCCGPVTLPESETT